MFYAKSWPVLGVVAAFLAFASLGPKPSLAEAPDDVAPRAAAILQQNCGSAGCHGGAAPYSFDVRNLPTLAEARVIEPGKASGSELILRLEAGVMPLGGYKGQAGAKLPAADIQTLKQWIDAGAPDPAQRAAGKPARPFMAEPAVLAAILKDLEAAPDRDRQFLRYYSLANLWNSADVEEKELALTRAALSKLVNHLSWDREITAPKSVGLDNTLLRIDLRDYGWTTRTWNRVVASYPYGARALSREEDRIRSLSGVVLPYIRADWFVTNASLPALYHDILQLPDTLDRLEELLRVDAAVNVQIARARRFAIRNSGVSRNNRAVERHPTAYGAYWKSFDFANNRLEANIFRNPIDLDPDGGEIIFNLPNGLQGYFIVDRQGKRLSDAPVNIVRDRTNTDDPVVHNGRSCIGCHIKGMNGFRDEIAATLATRVDAIFSLSRAEALYPGQVELDKLIEKDNVVFQDALIRSGNEVPAGTEDEPVSHVARRHEAVLSVSQAAADLYIQNAAKLQEFIDRSPALQRLGFNQLLGAKGGIKRDTWEEGFGALVQETRVGDFLSPGSPIRSVRNLDPRTSVVLDGAQSEGPARIVLNTDLGPGATYHGGEEVRISFKAATDTFFSLFSIDSSGAVHQLYPPAGAGQSRIRANQVVRLVDSGGRSLVQVDSNGVFDVETLVGVAGSSPSPVKTESGWDAFSRSLKTWSSGNSGGVSGQEVAILRFFTAP